MISPTARRVSPPECSASTFPPWRRTPPTYSEPSFEPSGSPTTVPRETSRGLSSTRCVKWPFIPSVSTAQGGKRAQFPSRAVQVSEKDENIYIRVSSGASELLSCTDHYSMCNSQMDFTLGHIQELPQPSLRNFRLPFISRSAVNLKAAPFLIKWGNKVLSISR